MITHTLDPWDGVKRSKHFFLNVVMLYIKLHVKRMELRAPYKHIFCPYTHPQPVGRVIKGKKKLNVVMSHIKLKGNKYRLYNTEAKTLTLQTSLTSGSG